MKQNSDMVVVVVHGALFFWLRKVWGGLQPEWCPGGGEKEEGQGQERSSKPEYNPEGDSFHFRILELGCLMGPMKDVVGKERQRAAEGPHSLPRHPRRAASR